MSCGIRENIVDDDAFWNWFAGFADADGCFGIRKGAEGYHRAGFYINLRADDIGILQEIQKRLGCGSIYIVTPPKEQNPIARFSIQTGQGAMRLVEVLDHHPLRAKKKRDYAIWRQAVREVNKPMDSRDKHKLSYLKEKLHKAKRFNANDTLGDYPKYKPPGVQMALPSF